MMMSMWRAEMVRGYFENFFKGNTYYIEMVPFVYPLKTSESHWFTDIFLGGVEMKHWPGMG